MSLIGVRNRVMPPYIRHCAKVGDTGSLGVSTYQVPTLIIYRRQLPRRLGLDVRATAHDTSTSPAASRSMMKNTWRSLVRTSMALS